MTGPHVDLAAVLLHDVAAHPQSETGSLDALRRKERFEDLVAVFARNSRTIIGNADAHALHQRVAPVLRFIHPNTYAMLRSFYRIEQDVAHKLADLVGIHLDPLRRH